MTHADRLRQMREAAAPRDRISAAKVVRSAKKPRCCIRKRRKSPRRGNEHDKQFLDWMHLTLGCLVAGRRPESPCGGRITFHHVRRMVHKDGTVERTGKLDSRGLMLCEHHHLAGAGPNAIHTMTKPGCWEDFFEIQIEAEIVRYQEAYADHQRSRGVTWSAGSAA